MSLMIEIIVSALLVIGGVFALVGSFGLIRLPDLLSRLHAPTKATTLGVGSVLAASMVYFFALRGELSIHELLITLFLFLTAPLTAHFVAKAYLLQRPDIARQLPPAIGEAGWATFDAPPVDATSVSEPPPGKRGGRRGRHRTDRNHR